MCGVRGFPEFLAVLTVPAPPVSPEDLDCLVVPLVLAGPLAPAIQLDPLVQAVPGVRAGPLCSIR